MPGGPQLLGGAEAAEGAADDDDCGHGASVLDEDRLDRADVRGLLDGERCASSGFAVVLQACPSSLIRNTTGAAMAHWPWSWHRSMSTVTFMGLLLGWSV